MTFVIDSVHWYYIEKFDFDHVWDLEEVYQLKYHDMILQPVGQFHFSSLITFWFVFRSQDLTYKIINYTSDGVIQDEQRQIFRDALNLWQSASRLRITEVNSDDADILVSFVTRTHGDNYPFDGEGGTLAHAFYPHNNEGKDVLATDYSRETPLVKQQGCSSENVA